MSGFSSQSIQASLVRPSKYRHLNGLETKSERHENINVGYGQKLSNTLKTNGSIYALPYNVTGGTIAFKSLTDYGRWDEKTQNYGIIKAHKGRLSDFDISPFRERDDLITVSNSDNIIRYWKLNSQNGNQDDSENLDRKYKIYEEGDCDLELNDTVNTKSTISRVSFNPYSDNSIVSVQGDLVHFWDVDKKRIIHTIQNFTTSTSKSPTVESLSWNEYGSTFICGTNDRLIRIYDIRSNQNSSSSSPLSTEAHSSMKPFQVLYCENNYVCSVGFSKSGGRELAMYDIRKDLKCLQRLSIDNGGSVLTPFYDNDIKLLYLVGRGDGNIRFYELDGGIMHYLNDYNCQSTSASVDWIPKWKLNVNNFELAKFLRLTNEKTIETLSMRVTRKSNIEQYFQEDIFPDTWNGMPIYPNSNDWFTTVNAMNTSVNNGGGDGSEVLQSKPIMSLKPEDKISIYDVPLSEGGKSRPLITKGLNGGSSSGALVQTPTTPYENTPTTEDTPNIFIQSKQGQESSSDKNVEETVDEEETLDETDDFEQIDEQIEEEAEEELIVNTHFNDLHQYPIDSLMSPTEATSKSISIGLVSNIGNNLALASAHVPWYKRMGYYLGMSMFLLFKFTLISIPVWVYRKTSGYKPPPIKERFEKLVPVMKIVKKITKPSANSSSRSTSSTTVKRNVKTDQQKPSDSQESFNALNSETTPTTRNDYSNNNTPQTPLVMSDPLASQLSRDISREYGRIIMDYVGKLTKEDIFPKRAHEKDTNLVKVLEIDVVDLKKGLTHVLIWVKGRKKARATLVPPYWTSLNHNDCFILDCGKILFIYNGQYSNKLCRAKALDMSQMIKYKERGGDCQVVILDGIDYNNQSAATGTSNSVDMTPLLKKQITQFWTEMGLVSENDFSEKLSTYFPKKDEATISSQSSVLSRLKLTDKSKYTCQDEINDDLYQQFNDLGQRLYKLNSEIFEDMPLKIENNETQDEYIQRISPYMLSVIKLNQIPGGEISSVSELENLLNKEQTSFDTTRIPEIAQPSHHVLHSDQCYIFESLFTNEVFFWSGKQSNLNIRKWGIAIAKKLSQYRALNNNPFSLKNPVLSRYQSILNENLIGNSPNKESFNMSLSNNRKYLSTITRVIEEGEHSIYKQKFSDYPGMLMIQTQTQESRGNVAEKKKQTKINFAELLMKKIQIESKQGATKSGTGSSFIDPTLIATIYSSKIRMWRVSDFQKISYPHIGHFFTADAYIIMYTYTKVEGGKSFHKLFFWQGRDIKKKDKGTSAYKTVEINEMIDEGVVEQQVRVVQDKEPKVFMDLFLLPNKEANENEKHYRKVPYFIHKGKYRPSVLESFEKANKLSGLVTGLIPSNSGNSTSNSGNTKLPKLNLSTTPSTPTTDSNIDDPQANQAPVKLFSNLSGNLDQNESENFSPQLLQFQKEMIERITSKDLKLDSLHSFDVRGGYLCETDDLHPNYLNPFHAMIFSNLNFIVYLNRIEQGREIELDEEIKVIVYYGKYCREIEKEFIQNNIQKLFNSNNWVTINGSDDSHVEELMNSVFTRNIDPTFEYFLSRFNTFTNSITNVTDYSVSLFNINDHSGEFTLNRLEPFGEIDLSSSQAFILDCLNVEGKVYVWIGMLCNVETKKFVLSSAIQYYYTWKSQTDSDEFYKKTVSDDSDEFDPSKYLQKQDENNLIVVQEMEEPQEFTKHFTSWSTNSTSFKVRFKQLQDPNVISKGFVKTPRTPRRSNLPQQTNKQEKNLFEHASSIFEIEHCSNVSQLYNKLFTHKTYSYAALSRGTLPEGIDKSKLESYLSNDEFQKVFGMDKKKFATLQSWKQSSLKKEKNLF